MDGFLQRWGEAAITSLGFFWMALWAFCLGYLISSMIQVFVTRQRMRRTMGVAGPRAVGMGTFFGFISSSCSFAALSTSRALFQKGAGLIPALAFLLASTNLVIELGIVIALFLSWHFVVAEYLGGLILILMMWAVVKLTLPAGLEQAAREHAKQAGGEHETPEDDDDGADHDDGQSQKPSWPQRVRSLDGWRRVAMQYRMEWAMVWKDVTFGFTIAGVIAAFIPPAFFETMFMGSTAEGGPAWWQVILHTLIGPAAAFVTFIGSMGNIPLAAILFGSGVSFAGVMAFIFSDLVVFPMLRISAQYFGWKMAAYILGVFLICLVAASLAMHFGFAALDLLPDPATAKTRQVEPAERFKLDYSFVMNIGFVLLSVGLIALMWLKPAGGEHGHGDHDHDHGGTGWTDRLLQVLAIGSLCWLAGGVVVWLVR